MLRELVAAGVAGAIAFASSIANAAEPLVFVADPKMGVETTVRSTDSIGRVVFRYEEALPAIAVNERTFWGKGAAVIGRGLELVFFDEPIAELVSAAAHEVGGHGARARELGLDPSYVFYLPGVYRAIFSPGDRGEAGAYTQYLARGVVEGDRALLGTLGGLEANYVHAWWIQSRIVRANGWVHHGDLLVYAASKLTYGNTLLAPPQDAASGNDVATYVTGLQDRKNQWRPEDRRRIARRIAAASLWNVLDPTLFYALYGTLVAKVWRGERTSRMPLPTIGGTTLLLSPRFGLTPFGAENTLDVFVARDGTMLDAYARVGTTGIADSYGVGARVLGIRAGERVTLGGELDVWRQPEVLLDERAVFDRPYRVGMNAGAYVDVHVASVLGITGKLASKTAGYVSGQPIAGGVHGYLGVSLALP